MPVALVTRHTLLQMQNVSQIRANWYRMKRLNQGTMEPMRTTKFILGAAAASLLTLSISAEARISRSGFPSKKELDMAEDQDLICKKQPATLGTRLARGEKVCLTKYQWVERIAENKDLMKETQRQSSLSKFGE